MSLTFDEVTEAAGAAADGGAPPSGVPSGAMLRQPQVLRATGLKRGTLYALMKRDEFPRAVRISARCVAWPESLIVAWLQERLSASRSGTAARDEAPGQRPSGADGCRPN